MAMRKDRRRVNFKMLARVMGWLLMIESAFMLIPAVVSLSFGEGDWLVFALSALFTCIVGYSLNHFIKPEYHAMGKREGFLLTAMVWIVFSLFGMLPFIFGSVPLCVGDAFFESMAGFTTTGCTAYPEVDFLSHGLNIWRALMQWIGGMGIILFTLAVLPMLNSSGGMQMFNAEVTGITHEKIRPRVSQMAKDLWLIYIVLTLICAMLLALGPMSIFDSVCHAFGTLSTGGFSTRSVGPSFWRSDYVDCVIAFFMFLGGTSFSLMLLFFLGKVSQVKSNATFRYYVGIILAMSVIFAANVLLRFGSEATLRDVIFDPLFQIVAIMTSTGYALPTLPNWGQLVLALLIPLMFFGACAGSTSGGAKIDRLLVLIKYVRNALKHTLYPNSITKVEIDGHILSSDTVTKAISFLALYCITICFAGIVLTALGIPIFDSCLTALSCVSNCGLSPDMFGGVTVISSIPILGKLVLAFSMLIGRLEVVTVLVLLMPAFWRK